MRTIFKLYSFPLRWPALLLSCRVEKQLLHSSGYGGVEPERNFSCIQIICRAELPSSVYGRSLHFLDSVTLSVELFSEQEAAVLNCPLREQLGNKKQNSFFHC